MTDTDHSITSGSRAGAKGGREPKGARPPYFGGLPPPYFQRSILLIYNLNITFFNQLFMFSTEKYA